MPIPNTLLYIQGEDHQKDWIFIHKVTMKTMEKSKFNEQGSNMSCKLVLMKAPVVW